MKKQFLALSFLVIILFVLSAVNDVKADTEVPGILNTDTVWTLENSPYIISSDILIEKNVNLTIEAGVIIKFKKGSGKSNFGGFEILNRGNIIAKGSSNNKIIFTSSEPNPQLGNWGTIEIVSGGSINFDNVEIKYASSGINAANALNTIVTNSHILNSGTGIYTSGPATILNNVIENNYAGIIYGGIGYSYRDDGSFSYSGTKKVEITYNNIRNNNGQEFNPYHAGIVIQDSPSNLTLSYNTIYNNGDGVKFTNSSSSKQLVMKDNNIYNNNYYNVRFNSKGPDIDMIGNWWETTDTVAIDSKIYDYYDDYISSLPKVNYKPFRTEFNTNAPIVPIITVCTSWVYSEWSSCPSSGQQTRSIISSSPSSCVGGNPVLTQSCAYIPPVCMSWTYSDWSTCPSIGTKTRTIISSSPSDCSGGNPILTQSCTYTPPTCTSWIYSDWGACANNQQTRTITSSQPANCAGGNPTLSQGCNSTPLCTENNWTSTLTPTNCPNNSQQTKTWSKIGQCQGGVSHPSEETVSCNYQIPTCTNFTYSDWSACSSGGVQYRTTLSASPSGCAGGSPVLTQSCTYIPPVCNSWTYSDWSACINGWQTRAINSSSPNNCTRGSPVVSRACQAEAEIKNVEIVNNNNQTAENNNANNSNSETNSSGKNSIEKETRQTQNQQNQIQEQAQDNSHANRAEKQEQVLRPEQNSPNNKAGTDKSENILEQKRSIVANAVQEMVKVADRNSGVGEQIKTIAQTQNQNQEQLGTSTQKIQTRSGFAKFFIGPDYGEIKKSRKLLEQNKEHIRQLNRLMPQIANQDDQKQITEQIQRLEQVNQQTETSLNEAQKGFSVLGWIFRLFAK